MQIDRLIQLTFLLMSREQMTATQLADYFGVSRRTIYRDIDALSIAGVPIYSNKGNGGGIGILKEYKIDKTMLSDKEQKEILHGLQVLKAAHYPDIHDVLNKMRVVFKNHQADWIDVDFSLWGSEADNRIKFSTIEHAIVDKYVISFDYFNSDLQKSHRIIEPLRLVFKSQTWYIQGFCRYKQEIRVFRMSRMKNLSVTEERFERDMQTNVTIEPDYEKSYDLVLFKLKFVTEIAHRIYDEFEEKYVERLNDGAFLVSIYYPLNEWMVSHILSFGNFVEVLEPAEARILIKERAKLVYEIY